MRYGFVNNFEQTLAVELAAGATTMTLDGGGALLTGISSTFRYRLTLIEEDAEGVEIGYELVDVTAASGDDLTIVRAREGTSDQLWPAGSRVALRITAAVANEFLQNDARIIWGGTFVSADPVPQGVVNLAYGGFITAEGPQVAIGDDVYNYGNQGVSIGFDSNVQDDNGIAIGTDVTAELRALSMGQGLYAAADAVAIGSADALSGKGAYGQKSIQIGHQGEANNDYSMAIGAGAVANLDGGLLVYGIPYIRLGTPTPLTGQPPACLKVASQAVFALEPLDLTSAGAVATLGLPDFAAIYIDSIEYVVVNSSSPGGTPEIKVGTDGTNTDNLLAATALTGLTERHRQKHAPLIDDGVVGVRAEVVTAGTGTINARVIVRCYVLEE